MARLTRVGSCRCRVWGQCRVSGLGSRAQVSDLGGLGSGVREVSGLGVWCVGFGVEFGVVWALFLVRFLFRMVWGLVFGLVFVWCGAVKCNLLALKLQDVQQRMRNLRPQDASGPL